MKKKLALVLSVVLLFSCLAGCGGGGTGSASPAPAESSEPSGSGESTPSGGGADEVMAQGITDTEILVGNSAAVSGAFATTGDPIVAGIQAYFDMVNAQGGIDGRTLRMIHIDDEYDPVKAKAAFQTLVEDEKVFAYVGHFGAPVVAATLDDIHDVGIPVVYFATGMGELYVEHAETMEDGANCYPIQPLYITEGEVMVARGVSEFDAKHIGVIYTSDDTGYDINEGVEKQCKALGLEYTSAQVTAGSSDVSAAVITLKEANVDFVVIAAAQATFPTIVKELAAQGMTVPAITTYVNTVITMAEQVASDIEGKFDVYAPGWLNYEGERGENLAAASEWLGDYAMNGYAHCGWIGAHFFCEGLRRLEGQTITWEKFVEAMEQAPIQIPFGGQVDYANGQRMGTQEMSLVVLDMESPTGWTEIDGLRSIDALLGK